MNYQRPIGYRDRVARPNGDRGWRGVNMRLDPAQLEEGWASEAVNVRFRNGIAETRLGSMVMPWLNKITAGNVQPWSAVYGAGVFRDPTTAQEYVLIAAEGNVYACQQNNAPILLTLPAGVTVVTECRFQQAFDVVLLLRGFNDDPLVMSSIVTGFEEIDPSPGGTGTLEIPPSLRSVAAANRVFVADDDDSILASDILDYTHYSLTNNYRINQGSDDRIVNLSMFGSGTIIALKGKSVYRVDNVYGDLTASTLSTVTGRYGCAAAESVVDCGNDLLWLSHEGVASLTLTTQNEIQSAQGALAGKYRMFSEDIGPLIDRVNWRYASGAVGAVWNDCYYLALPVDQAEMMEENLVSNNATTNSGGTYTVSVVSGATYEFITPSGDWTLTSGATSTTKSISFTTATTTAVISGTGDTALPAELVLRRVYRGVNNVIAVYDFQNAAWTGYDQADGLAVKRFIKARYNNRERLFAVMQDGWVRLMEEDYADRLSRPYVDILFDTTSGAANVPNGTTFVVNSGTTITASTATDTNSGTTWGVDSDNEVAWQNLWGSNAARGYSLDSTTPWSAPNTTTSFVEYSSETAAYFGVRFRASNGVLPTVTTTGTWYLRREVVEQDIPVTLVTRGYSATDGTLSKFTGAAVDVQTWAPTVTLELLADGVNETETLVDAVTRDRSKYTRTGVPDYDQTNADDTFYNPYREDYSIQPTGSSFEFAPGANVYGHLHQESRLQESANSLGRSARLRVTNSTGRIRVMQAQVGMVEQPAPAGFTT